MKFLQDKDGRQLLISDEIELTCFICRKRNKDIQWYWAEGMGELFCDKCVRQFRTTWFCSDYRKPIQPPLIKIDKIGRLKKMIISKKYECRDCGNIIPTTGIKVKVCSNCESNDLKELKRSVE